MDFTGAPRIAIDETSSRRGHKYVSRFVDAEAKKVMFVTPGKDSTVLNAFSILLEQKDISNESITEVCSDMSPAFIKGITGTFPNTAIPFDKFHVMKLLNEAVDHGRRP